MRLSIKDREFQPSPLGWEYLNAFRVVCAHESWEWTCSKLLKGFVRLKLAELKRQRTAGVTKAASATPTTSSAARTKLHKIAELLGFYFLLQSVAISTVCPSSEKFQADVASDILKPYADELSKDNIGN